MEFDTERLRTDLINYFGTASSFFPVAYMDLFEVQNASNDKIIQIAIDNNFNIDDYRINLKKY